MSETEPAVPRILLVEASDLDASLIQAALRDSGIVEERVTSLGAALVTLRASAFDLILTDLILPDSAGAAIVEALLEGAGVAPVIVLIAPGDELVAHDAINAGAQDYLVKGSTQLGPQVVRTVEYALRRARERLNGERRQILGANAKFRALIDCSEALMVLDAHGRCSYASPSVREMFGYEPDEVIGQPVHELIGFGHLDPSAPASADALLRHSDGALVDVQYTVVPMRDEEGGPAGTVITFRGVARQKELEQQLEQTLRLALLGQAAASAVHDLNNLLTIISQQAELLLRRSPGDAALARSIGYIRDAVGRGRRLSEEIRRFGGMGAR